VAENKQRPLESVANPLYRGGTKPTPAATLILPKVPVNPALNTGGVLKLADDPATCPSNTDAAPVKTGLTEVPAAEATGPAVATAAELLKMGRVVVAVAELLIEPDTGVADAEKTGAMNVL
jgi:hypothetical protein